ncbi:hypothetical protein HHK36_002360 [Tetracentron sinense]|uniref:EF-hand domain-containing protein n=1 Tax=Tetracentron sinense TaxID=13715 RepID=A0A834ZP84_TETSI|nr:hypothetical protein HHK36_002360 [Tetracentron sinense]
MTTSLERHTMGSPPKSPRKADASKCSELERVFRYLDEDGDGKISAAELQTSVRTIGGELSAEEAEAVVGSSGLLGFDEFAKLMESKGGEEEEEEDLREAFGMYEMDGCGCITPKSLKRMLKRLGESKTTLECKAIISVFDRNGDGVLSFHEFRLMMR